MNKDIQHLPNGDFTVASKMTHVMIDIETMGLGHNAAMIQLAGVYFDPLTGETGEEFCQNLSLENCLEWGFEVTASTEQWWREQNQDVLNEILSNAKPVRDVINQFTSFIRDAQKIWSHAIFDFVIVQNYLKKFNLKPMPHKGAMDIRTLVYLSGIDLDSYDWSAKTHNALDDCKFQIRYCSDAMRMLKCS